MNIMHKLTRENLRKNQKRTIVTIIGIILSTALICAVVGMVTSGIRSIVEWTKDTEGDFHALFSEVPAEDLKYVTENDGVVDAFTFQSLGFAKVGDSLNNYKPYYYVMEADENAFSKLALSLVAGRFPENHTEIVIPQHAITNGGQELTIGDTLTIDIGTRVDLETGLQVNNYQEYEEEIPEEIRDTTTHSYTIVGIIKRPSHLVEAYWAPGYTLFSHMDAMDQPYADAGITLKSAKTFYNYTDVIQATLDESTPNSPYTCTFNTTLLEYEGSLSSRTLNVLYSLAAIILGIIILTSVFVIRNSFAISVSEKTRQYGMLASIGATSRQIRGSVLYEGFLIGLIGIPLGIGLGLLAIFILLKVMGLLLSPDLLQGMNFIFYIPWIVPVLTVILGAVTIFFSCLLPANRAAKIAPIEAIRGNQDVKIRASKLRTSKLTYKLFGMGGTIASKNLKRSRRKYRTTVVSLVVSIAVFVALSSFVDLGKETVGYYYTDYGYNINVWGMSDTEETESLIQEAGIDRSRAYYYWNLSANIDAKYGSEETTAHHFAEDPLYTMVVILPDTQFAQFAEQIGYKGDLSTAAILFDEGLTYDSETGYARVRATNLSPSDTLTYSFSTWSEELDQEVTLFTRDFTIAKLTMDYPAGYEHVMAEAGILYIPRALADDEMMEMAAVTGLYIDAADPDQTEQTLTQLKQQNPVKYGSLSINNLHAEAEMERRMILIVEIFLYGFIAVITLIGVTNIFNTISTNMMLRRKEFAMLKSVGMTNKEFHRMIRLENILYSLKSLVIGIPLGLGGSYAIYRAASGEMDLGYQVPWSAMGISVLFVFLIVGLTMSYSLRKINAQNIVETIRSENI